MNKNVNSVELSETETQRQNGCFTPEKQTTLAENNSRVIIEQTPDQRKGSRSSLELNNQINEKQPFKLTIENLKRFIELRNKKRYLVSGFRFREDAELCGFSADQLGKATSYAVGGWIWETPFGYLFEYRGSLELLKGKP